MDKSTLGSALLAGDEQCRSQVNAFLLSLMHNHTRDEPRHSKHKKSSKRRKASKRSDKDEHRGDRKRRRKDRAACGHQLQRPSAALHVHQGEENGSRVYTELQVLMPTATSAEVTVPVLRLADSYDFFDYHYYPPYHHSSSLSLPTTPLPSPRSSPSSPCFSSPLLSSNDLSPRYSLPRSTSETGPAFPLPLALSLSSFAIPAVGPSVASDDTPGWALPSRSLCPTLDDWCSQHRF
jgi:hypothetical protein